MRSISRWSLAVAASALLFTACDSAEDEETPPVNAGTGTVTLQAWGEDYIDDEIPADDVIDEWTITFESVLVAVSDVTLDGHGDPALLPSQRIVDLAAGPAGAKTLETTEVPAGLYSTVQYRVSPAAADYDQTGLSDAEIAMVEDGASVVLIGTATKESDVGAATHDFYWSFKTDTTYTKCQIDTTVEKDGEAGVELTFHIDHLFNDDLDEEEPNIAFDLIASAATGEGPITESQLRAVDITGETRYQVGSRPISDLWAYIEHQTTTLGHINGEGHCGE